MKLNPNPIVQYLQKEPSQFTKSDIIKYIVENEIKMLDFHYAAGDGRLKTLNFVISSQDYLDQILSTGERVDGSSLFSFMEAGSSDLYVIPRFSTAFVDPFSSLETIGLFVHISIKMGISFHPHQNMFLTKHVKNLTGLVMVWNFGQWAN